ncbi:MAG TPA: glucan biosynthesis protein G [Rhodocyclaceae bacterium]|nr:glucan biosynthesis protein G [Rhodocyclaceae bacterium]
MHAIESSSFVSRARRPRWLWWQLLVGTLLTLSINLSAHAFDFNDVAKRARALAQKPYTPNTEKLPAALQALSAQKYRDIHMKPDNVLWHNAKNAFEVELLPPGDVFTTPVRINEITNQGVHDIRFNGALFDYGDSGIDQRTMAAGKLGFSGMRIRYSANGKTMEDLLQIQGASYLHGQLKGQQGVLARGLAIDTALNSGEKFPQFVELWLERPANGDKELGIYALLDSPDMTGAYRFVLRPGTDTVVDVKAQLYLRKAPQKIGIAPLTGMFYFGENQPRMVEDYRPEVHNIDGLAIHGSDGEWIWRPLSNPKRLLVTSFAQSNPDGFGLVQRDRNFSSYEDIGARYDLRPSVWIEPKGKWGDGRIELVQIPSPNEWNDNIVAYWVPDALPSAGQPLAYEYRLSWFRDGHRPANAWATQTRWSYRNKPDNSATVLIDFEGPALKPFDANNPLEGVASCDANGKVLSSRTYYNEATGGWRMELQVQRADPTRTIETRAFLRKDNTTLSETWSYILPPAN